jgi:hypothetical protein
MKVVEFWAPQSCRPPGIVMILLSRNPQATDGWTDSDNEYEPEEDKQFLDARVVCSILAGQSSAGTVLAPKL